MQSFDEAMSSKLETLDCANRSLTRKTITNDIKKYFKTTFYNVVSKSTNFFLQEISIHKNRIYFNASNIVCKFTIEYPAEEAIFHSENCKQVNTISRSLRKFMLLGR